MSAFKYKINYQGSSKVIRRIVDKVNNIVALGVEHDEAYYGDQGEAAWQHRLLRSGNPHRVTLEDLGIETLPRRVQALLEATGSADNWGTHEFVAGEAEVIIDHEGDYLMFLSVENLLAWH